MRRTLLTTLLALSSVGFLAAQGGNGLAPAGPNPKMANPPRMPGPAAGCRSANTMCTTGRGTGNNIIFALHVPVDAAPKTVLGLELYTRTLRGLAQSATVRFHLYLGNHATGPSGPPVATGTMVVGQKLGWYGGNFPRPVQIQANQSYFLAHDTTGMDHPICGSGTPVPYHWRYQANPTWHGIFRVNWAYIERSVGCAGSNYISYGKGCAGTVHASCPSKNLACTRRFSGGNANEFALHVVAPAANIITAIRLKTARRFGTGVIPIRVYRDANGLPGALAGATTIAIGPAYAVYTSAPFRTPILIKAKQKYYVSFAGADMYHPICPSGGTPTKYHVRVPPSTTWLGVFQQAWTYAVVCATQGPGIPPDLTPIGTPKINRVFTVNVQKAAPNAPTVLLFGASSKQWGALPLPFDLTPFGAKGCSILASGEVTIGGKSSTTGVFSVSVKLPNSPALINQSFFNQGFVLDRGANTLGVSSTRGGKATVGN